MNAFIFRLAALGIRFLCPLAALALSNAETMGEYYLFISYFTFVVGISALELAVPYSRKFLRCKTDRQRRIMFSGFVVNQGVVTAALAIPAGILVSNWAGVPSMLIPLFCFSLATEATVNEVGRFFWNIGEWQMPSVRDFIRATIFTVAIVGSVYFENEVLTAFTFLIIAVGNICILSWEWKSWGRRRLAGGLHFARLVKSAWLRVQRSLSGSLHQFAHMQLLGLQPLLERTLVEKTSGLAVVAAFSLLTSVMQSAAGLLLVPLVAAVRQRILSARTIEDHQNVKVQVLRLLIRVLTTSGAFAFGVYLIFPLFKYFFDKDIQISLLLAFAAYISSVSAIFSSAIAPLLTVGDRAWKVNALCLLVLLPLMIMQWMRPSAQLTALGVVVITAVCLSQIGGRVMLVLRDV